jgi:transcriptional regulator with XRE-family HTH domain
MSELVERLKKELHNEDYRYAYDEEFSNSRMATQIKVLREQQELKQSELAELAGMKQSRISELENVNYNSWSISTLRRLARALGVRLSFAFESWGELLPEADTFGRRAFERPRFEKDPTFQAGKSEMASVMSRTVAPSASQQTSLRIVSGTTSGVTQTSFAFDRPQLARVSGSQVLIQKTQEESDIWQKIQIGR